MSLTIKEKTIHRFWAKVDTSGECWNWIGAINTNGYGRFRLFGIPTSAHRASFIINYGSIPELDEWHGMCVLHKCDNKCCVNPEHLFLGTQQDNIIDMYSKGRGHSNPSRGKDHYRYNPELHQL